MFGSAAGRTPPVTSTVALAKHNQRSRGRASSSVSAPAGVAAVQSLTVKQERQVLQQERQVEKETHRAGTRTYNPYLNAVFFDGRWRSVAEFVLAFRRGQRDKTRHSSSTAGKHSKARGGR